MLAIALDPAAFVDHRLLPVLGHHNSYHAEPHPVGARVLENTRAQITLLGTDDDQQDLLSQLPKWFGAAVS